ncbi:MAG: hypothetical protein NHB32_01380 [Fischerella sp. CENA71]|nr:hypothetical protein [Fischerella sp. CENA71]
MCGRGDAGTRGCADAGTRGRGDAGMCGRGDAGTWGDILIISPRFPFTVSPRLLVCFIH